VQTADARVKERTKELAELQAKVLLTPPNTDAYRRAQEEVNAFTAEMKRDIDNQAKAFRLREAAVMHEAYQRTTAAVKLYCETHGIKMVLRTNTHVVNPLDPNTVLTLVNQPIVYRDTLDITDAIVAVLNEAEPAKSE
jgi:hypothetical protein